MKCIDNNSKDLMISYIIKDPKEIPIGVNTCIIYVRVSTKQHAQELSYQRQLDEALEYATSSNYFVLAYFVEKQSATNDISRLAYMSMLEYIREFKPHLLFSKCDDRLNRNVGSASNIMTLTAETGTRVHYLMTGQTFDYNNPDDILVGTIHAMFSQQFSIQQHKKANDYYSKKFEKGWLSSQNNTFGYRFNKETRQMEIEPTEAQYVKKIFEWYVFHDMGSKAISLKLAELGVMGYGSNNKYVTPQFVLKILKNRAYIGEMSQHHTKSTFRCGSGVKSERTQVPKSEYTFASVPPIISKELFDLAAEIREEHSISLTNSKGENNKYGVCKGSHLFASKIRCGDCNSPFRFKFSNREKTKGRYRCSFSPKVNKDKCNNTEYSSINEETLITITKECFDKLKEERDTCFSNVLNALAYALENEHSKKDNDEETILKGAISKLESELSKLKNAVLALDGNSLLAKEIANEYEEKSILLIEQKAKLSSINNSSNIYDDKKQRLEKLSHTLDEMNSYKNFDKAFVNRFIDKIIINTNGVIEIYLYLGKVATSTLPPNKGGSSSSTIVANSTTLDDRQ